MKNTYQQEKDEELLRFFVLFSLQELLLSAQKVFLFFVDIPSLRSARYICCFAKYIRKTANSICFRYAQTRYDINPRSRSEHIELLMVHSCHQQYIERVSVYRKSAFADLYRCVPALWQVRYRVLAVEQYEIENILSICPRFARLDIFALQLGRASCGVRVSRVV